MPRHLARPTPIRTIGLCAATACILAACRADTPTGTHVAPPPVATAPAGQYTSITVKLPAMLELYTIATAGIEIRDLQYKLVNPSSVALVWSSSDSATATVVDGAVMALRPGRVTITATAAGVSGSAVVDVAWGKYARLIPSIDFTVEAGDPLLFDPTINGYKIPLATIAWSTSNPQILRLDAPGAYSALAPGRATIVASLGTLVDSLTIDVVAAASGFGYFYSGNATAIDYYGGPEFWAPEPGKSYSTGGRVSALWGPPYESTPNLGWFGAGSSAHRAVMYAATLDGVPCATYLTHSATFIVQGAPQVSCWDYATRNASGQHVRMEFLAFTPDQFTGTFAALRADGSRFATSADGLHESYAEGGTRAYTMPGVSRDSLYWFVTPGADGIAVCGLTPNDSLAPGAVVRIGCTREYYGPKDPTFYAVAFGPDTRHGSAPIGFAEIDGTGAIARQALDGLEIAATGSNGSFDVVVSGARLVEFDRLPAVLVSAVASYPVACGLTEPVRASSTTVTFRATCTGATGVMLGVVY